MSDSSDSQVRLNGLKLLGALMTNLHDLFEDTSLLIKMQSSLEGLSNLDSSPETRALAEKYLSLLNG